jgi:methylated-DNA-[protein]-cysteine S-methyltransferase
MSAQHGEIDMERIRDVLRGGGEDRSAAAAASVAELAERERLLDVAYASYDSPLGTGYVAATERGIVAVALPNHDEDDFLEKLADGISPRVLELPARLDEARRELDQYFEGGRRRFELELDWALVPPGFYGRVLRVTAKLPFGATATYSEVAREAGNPRAYRAAGTALGTNPIPLVVPCHRVLRSGGVIGNYGGGPEMKRFLLEHEGAIHSE